MTSAPPPQPAPHDAAHISAAERALAVLDYVGRAEKAPTLMEIAGALGLPKATASRLCNQLLARQWLLRHAGERRFSPGARLLALARHALHADPRQALRHEVLLQLVAQLGETCNLTVLDGSRVRYLERAETHWPLRMQLGVGSLVPLHATASGKLFLAHMPPAQRRAMLACLALDACTPHTLASAQALEAECARIARDGYACDREEFMLGMIALAVPVCDARGQCRAAVAVHAPAARLPLGQALHGLPHLHAAARRMADLLF